MKAGPLCDVPVLASAGDDRSRSRGLALALANGGAGGGAENGDTCDGENNELLHLSPLMESAVVSGRPLMSVIANYFGAAFSSSAQKTHTPVLVTLEQ